MRLHHEDINGPDALKAELVRFAVILLNGERQNGVIWADEEAGELECYIMQDDPRFEAEFNKLGRSEWPTEKKQGRVRIKDSRDEYKPTR